MMKTLVLLTAALMLTAAAPAAPRTDSGRTLVIPDQHRDLGTSYYVHPGKDAQVTFTSDAALEHIKGTSNRVVGYAIAPTDGRPAAELLAGEFRLPVDSIDTGIDLRNEHLQSGRWLNADDHPDVVFELEKSENVSLTSERDGFEMYTAELVGRMTVRGETRPFRTEARITLMPESEITRRRAPGDLMVIRAAFPIDLRAYGLNDPSMSAGVVAEEVTIDTFLMLSTASPDRPRQ